MDILSDFYKRFGHEGGIASEHFVPASVCIFKSISSEVGLSLSFGAGAVYRKRSDGRIILTCSDSNIKESINIADIDKFKGSKWAEDIINTIKKLPPKNSGCEILLHSDVGAPSLIPQLLCAVSAYSTASGEEIPPQTLISTTNKNAYELVSAANERIAVVSSASLSYMTYKPDFKGKKIIVIETGKKHKPFKSPTTYTKREAERIAALAASISSLGNLMYDASKDMLSLISPSELSVLFSEAKEFTQEIRILPNLTGALVILEENAVDEFIKIFSGRYEKKTGLTPAFYISD